VRVRLATVFPDDAIRMEFLASGGEPHNDDDWKNITEGSPGERSAAMLTFMLSHGSDPLVLDQPEDDLDSEWITDLVVPQLRRSRWKRQLVVVTHNANIPVNADAEFVVVMENRQGVIGVRSGMGTDDGEVPHVGSIEDVIVRRDIQDIMEGGVAAFVLRERRYNNELNRFRIAKERMRRPGS
jgi:ABC-type cobalamin/Fe3+-siderophores transport system ATPase subunit